MRSLRRLICLSVLPAALIGSGAALARQAPGEGAGDVAAEAPEAAAPEETFRYFGFMSDPHYDRMEKVALWVVLGVAAAGLIYAAALVRQVTRADEGTPKMQAIAAAIRQGANAYLGRQFRAVVGLVFLITAVLYFTAESTEAVRLGRAAAFFLGATFSWLVGFIGMRLAVRGNLRVAAAARSSYVWRSKTETREMREMEAELATPALSEPAA